MKYEEFYRLISRGVLTPTDSPPRTSRAIAHKTGVRITLRPDLPGLPVTTKEEKQ